MKTKIKKWGNSQGIRISKEILKLMKWQVNEEVSISIHENKLIIEKSDSLETDLNIRDLFNDYNDNYIFEEINWGESVGEEMW